MPKKVNFHCNKCKKDFLVSTFITSYPEGKTVYKKENRKDLISCEHCGSTDIKFVNKEGVCINYGKFSSSSLQGKQEILLKRAKAHDKTPSFIEESRHRDRVQTIKTLKNIGK